MCVRKQLASDSRLVATVKPFAGEWLKSRIQIYSNCFETCFQTGEVIAVTAQNSTAQSSGKFSPLSIPTLSRRTGFAANKQQLFVNKQENIIGRFEFDKRLQAWRSARFRLFEQVVRRDCSKGAASGVRHDFPHSNGRLQWLH